MFVLYKENVHKKPVKLLGTPVQKTPFKAYPKTKSKFV